MIKYTNCQKINTDPQEIQEIQKRKTFQQKSTSNNFKKNISYQNLDRMFKGLDLILIESQTKSQTVSENEDQNNKKNLNRIEIKKLEQSLIKADDVFSQLCLALLYAKMNNQALTDKIIGSIIQQEFLKLTFEIYVPFHLRDQFFASFLKLLKGLENTMGNRKLWDSFLVYLYNSVGEVVQDALYDHFDITVSPITIRKMSSSFNYGRPYPALWFPLLKHHFGVELAEEYLENSDFYTQLKKENFASMWILTDYFPANKKNREILWSAFQKLRKIKMPYYEDLVYRLMNNDAFRLFVIQQDAKFQKPIFLEKRKHYKNLLNRGYAIDYALYNLMLLGDYNSNYIFHLQQK